MLLQIPFYVLLISGIAYSELLDFEKELLEKYSKYYFNLNIAKRVPFEIIKDKVDKNLDISKNAFIQNENLFNSINSINYKDNRTGETLNEINSFGFFADYMLSNINDDKNENLVNTEKFHAFGHELQRQWYSFKENINSIDKWPLYSYDNDKNILYMSIVNYTYSFNASMVPTPDDTKIYFLRFTINLLLMNSRRDINYQIYKSNIEKDIYPDKFSRENNTIIPNNGLFVEKNYEKLKFLKYFFANSKKNKLVRYYLIPKDKIFQLGNRSIPSEENYINNSPLKDAYRQIELFDYAFATFLHNEKFNKDLYGKYILSSLANLKTNVFLGPNCRTDKTTGLEANLHPIVGGFDKSYSSEYSSLEHIENIPSNSILEAWNNLTGRILLFYNDYTAYNIIGKKFNPRSWTIENYSKYETILNNKKEEINTIFGENFKFKKISELLKNIKFRIKKDITEKTFSDLLSIIFM